MVSSPLFFPWWLVDESCLEYLKCLFQWLSTMIPNLLEVYQFQQIFQILPWQMKSLILISQRSLLLRIKLIPSHLDQSHQWLEQSRYIFRKVRLLFPKHLSQNWTPPWSLLINSCSKQQVNPIQFTTSDLDKQFFKTCLDQQHSLVSSTMNLWCKENRILQCDVKCLQKWIMKV